MRSALTGCSAHGLGAVAWSVRRRRRACSASVEAGQTSKDAVIVWAFPLAGAPPAPAQRRANGGPHARSSGVPSRTARPGSKRTATGHCRTWARHATPRSVAMTMPTGCGAMMSSWQRAFLRRIGFCSHSSTAAVNGRALRGKASGTCCITARSHDHASQQSRGAHWQCLAEKPRAQARPFEEPGAVVPHAGICAGAVGELAVLPRWLVTPFHGRATGRNCSAFPDGLRSRPGSSSLGVVYAAPQPDNRKELGPRFPYTPERQWVV